MSLTTNHWASCVLFSPQMVLETTIVSTTSIRVTNVAPIHVNLSLSGTRVIMNSTTFRCFPTLSKLKLVTNLTLWSTLVEMVRPAWDRIVRTGAMQEALVLVLDLLQTPRRLTLLMLTTGSNHQANPMGAPRPYLMVVSAHASTKCVALSTVLDRGPVNPEHPRLETGSTTRSNN